MKITRGLKNITNQQNYVATIGNFDGMHTAHISIIQQLIATGIKLDLPTMVISFYPHPNDFLKKKISTISNCNDKYNILKNIGVDELLLINFNAKFANLSANDFIQNLLIKQLNIKYLLIGDDFHFGKNRTGNINILKQHISIDVINALYLNNIRISSSNIRKYLDNGDIKTANHMLGRKFNISGKVVTGDGRGKTIGFPTINIAFGRRLLPIAGVFAVTITITNTAYKGVANIGTKPTFDGKNTTLEVHIFNFNKEIYNHRVTVNFIDKIRNEQKFSTIDELKKQIIIDINLAKKIFTVE